MTKPCSKCGEVKPLEDYYAAVRMLDGRRSDCKACVRARQKVYREANLGKITAYQREWYTTHPHITWAGRYRARARGYGFDPVVEAFTRDDLIARYGDACFHCGGPFEELDHWPTPVAHGGHHTLDNSKPACRGCQRAQSGTRANHLEAMR